MSYSKKKRFADVTINEFSSNGNGLGQFKNDDGEFLDAEISFAIPGDLIRSKLLNKKRRQWQGQIEEIIQPSKDRIIPKCKHFGICGGCRWQQMSYEAQLRYKESVVRELFTPLVPSDGEIRPIVRSVSEWKYRNKMEFTFSSDLNRNKYLGLIMDSSKGKVVSLSECHLANDWFIETVKAVKLWWEESTLDAYNMWRNSGSLRTLTLREGVNTNDRMIMLTVSGNPEFALSKNHLNTFVDIIRQSTELKPSEGKLSIFVRIQQVEKGMATNFYDMPLYGPRYLEEKLNIQVDLKKPPIPLIFKVSPTSFFQPNPRQAELFFSIALQIAGVNENTVVYDLFCGVGTLGICAAKYAKRVIGIELSPEAAWDARQNIDLNGCKNMTILTGAVRHVLKDINDIDQQLVPDVAFVDPPRAGLDPTAMKELKRLNPNSILFISCQPKNQAANVMELISYGYKIKTVQPVDQFPQTNHIENMVYLVRNGNAQI